MNKHLSRNSIKYIAVFAMLLDHIAFLFLPFPESTTSVIFHFIGRITAPIMCFFLAEGFYFTTNLKKYKQRLFVFALISQIPWYLFHGEITFTFNFLFTLLICLFMLEAFSKTENKTERYIYVCVLVALTYFCDWGLWAPLWTLGFYQFRKNKTGSLVWFSFVNILYFAFCIIENYINLGFFSFSVIQEAIYTLGTFLAMAFLLLYNHENRSSKKSKWFFYVFYPLHMLILALIKSLF